MKRLEILPFGSPVLRSVARPVTVFHKKLQMEIDAVAATLAAQGGGVALAAPQVGIAKRVVVMNYHGEYLELVNPEVVEVSGWSEDSEGCLSFEGYVGQVGRPAEVRVRYQDRNGTSHEIRRDGAIARCLQHEIDHLNGVLFIDRLLEPFVTRPATGEVLRADVVMRIAGVPPPGAPTRVH